MARSGWAALAATFLLVAGLGSEPAFDVAADADRQAAPLLRTLTDFPGWTAGPLGLDSDIYVAIAVKIVVLLALMFVLGRAAGHVGASFAAFLAGWGSLMIASAVAGMAYVLVADTVVLDGQLADSQGGAGTVVVRGLNSGVAFGLYTGWFVGIAVVATARRGGLPAAEGWQDSLPGQALPAPDPMAGMGLVPGMASVSSPGAPGAPGAYDPDAWVPPATDPWATSPAASSSPAGRDAGDPWGPQALSDPAARAASAPVASPAPAASTEGQPFLPAGTWHRQPGEAVGSLPTAENPTVPPAGWPASARPEAEAPSAPGAPIVPSGSWPPSARPDTEPPEAAGTGQPFLPSGSWPPSARDPQASNGGASPPSHEQPEPSGSAPSPPIGGEPSGPRGTPAPAPAGGGASPQAGRPARPLWPSAWPAASGGPLTGEQDVVAPADEDDEGTEGSDQPDGANTRFW